MSINPPLITVYVVNHNYGRFLRQAMDSVLAQTMQDFEILLIDDGSTDGSQTVVEEYAGVEKIYPILQQNKGLTVTNNIALRMARGKYIMRLDADDYLDKNALLVMSRALESEPDVGLVFPDYYEVDENGNLIQQIRRHNFEKVELLDQPAHGACTMLRVDLLRELGGYDESLNCQDGYDLWIRFVQHYRVRNINLPLFYYRQHGKSLTQDEHRILNTRSEILRKQAERLGHGFKTIAVIPVRGSHSDPQSLALRRLGSRAVLDWTIDAALNSRRVHDVIITTPDDAIENHVAKNYGGSVVVIRRDQRMARINTYIDETVLHALEHYSRDQNMPDAVAVLAVEAPFRKPHQIDAAIESMEVFETDRVVGVRLETANFYQHKGQGLEPLRSHRTLGLESEGIYREAGVIQVCRTAHLLKTREMYGGRVGHIVVDQRSAHLLHSPWDWQIAETEARRAEEAEAGHQSEPVRLRPATN